MSGTGETPAGQGRTETFRDSLGIVSTEGKRTWIYPKRIIGGFYRLRTLFSVLLLAALVGTPFLKVDGHPFMLFDVLNRRFILFGVGFGPQDFWLFALALITLVVFIVLFTVVFGRLFCGWVCPQTVFMEMVFRKIDYRVEGDHAAQRRLNAAPWNGAKILRKGTKHLLYAALSFLIANTLLAYVVGVDELLRVAGRPPAEHPGLFAAVAGFSVLFHWIFAWFREQACILVCPYGRLQGVLLDRRSIVIAYDHVRGEPRAPLKRGVERTAGDCVDCDQCVEVCPTGIDIRNGTQLECVNCTACIDACDMVMDRVTKPRGLIRYASMAGIEEKAGFRWTPRVIGYTVVLVALSGVLTTLLAARSAFDVTVLRTPGMFYQEQPGDMISNVYDVKIVNKTFDRASVDLRLLDLPGEVRLMGDPLRPGPQATVEGKVLILLPRTALTGMSTPVRVGVYGDTTLVQSVTTSFLGPVAVP